MSKTSKEFVSNLTGKLGSKMHVIENSDGDQDKMMTAVCEAETVLCILKEYLELEKENSRRQSTTFSDLSEDDDYSEMTPQPKGKSY